MSKEFSITTLQPCWDWLDNVTRSGKDQIETSADPQSNPQLLGCVGRLEHGWDGLVHLFPRAGSGFDRVAAPIRNPRDNREHRLLWRPFFRAFHDRVRNGPDLGPDRGPLWPRSHDDVQYFLFFTIYAAGRVRHGRMELGGFPVHGGSRNWRRVVGGGRAGFRRLARGTPHDGRGADAHRLLHWFFLCRGGQRFYRQPLWMEVYVCAGWRSGAFDRLDSQQRPGAGALGK